MERTIEAIVSDARTSKDKAWRAAMCRAIQRILEGEIARPDIDVITRLIWSDLTPRRTAHALVHAAESAFLRRC